MFVLIRLKCLAEAKRKFVMPAEAGIQVGAGRMNEAKMDSR
jgi:hypothetical protein